MGLTNYAMKLQEIGRDVTQNALQRDIQDGQLPMLHRTVHIDPSVIPIGCQVCLCHCNVSLHLAMMLSPDALEISASAFSNAEQCCETCQT